MLKNIILFPHIFSMKALYILIFTIVIIFFSSKAVLAQDINKTVYSEAIVLDVKKEKATGLNKSEVNTVKLKILKGDLKDRNFEVKMDGIKKLNFSKGDQVTVSYLKSPSGQENVYINDYVRTKEMLLLFFLFLALVFLIGRWKGITSFLGMVFSFVIIGGFIIPNILLGNDPVLISLLGALFIIPITFYLGHGFNRKTTIALAGTFIALVITGILSYIFVNFTRLTGFASEEAAYLQVIQGDNINIVSLLLAGIIIGAMGVLDDITISQTSIVERLKIANPKYHLRELYKQAMIVGRDHIASLVNTLILVYSGASLPLFLLFYNSKMPYGVAVNSEVITTEIVRTLVSSIGIILAVPITTFIAAMFIEKKT